MKLYHGSNKEIVTPLYGKGRNDCDYGSGFYLCPEKDVASLWASQNEDGGYINSYKLNIDKLKILNLGHINKEYILTWITILCRFRLDNETRATAQEEISILTSHFDINLDEYDVIIGFRADDSFFDYARAFLTNQLPIELLSDAMKAGNLGIQYALKSRRAFEEIKFIDSERIAHDNRYKEIEETANREYEQLLLKRNINQTYLRDILREII